MEELFSQFLKIGMVVERVLSECLGLPPCVLKDFNSDRSWDFLIALFYLPATEKERIGASSHKDVSCFTIVLQDEVARLEVQKDGEWILIAPQPGALVVNIGDALQFIRGQVGSTTAPVYKGDGRKTKVQTILVQRVYTEKKRKQV
ncbi:hypothetical protein K7X08_022394 [Anisodus acutangulus]|uniref:Fe2OG dioxygenase domain-containing protein n=1 Tax=Anisodus acutangulus TaxID=402998 RepID=A0A9Q1RKB5_9SOLA|nr:hypothetical protein K7X08_022394 [Anisodus acutangulus]